MPATRNGRRAIKGEVDDSSWVMPKVAPEKDLPGLISFALNLTPDTYNDPLDALNFALDETKPRPADPLRTIDVPDPALYTFQPTSGKKSSHSKKKPDDYIPRPPNAFILFRSEFVKAPNVKRALAGVEHKFFSNVAAHVWNKSPDCAKAGWYRLSKVLLDDHKFRYPDYSFKPKNKKGDKAEAKPKRKMKEGTKVDTAKCEFVGEKLLAGVQGEEMVSAIAEFDKQHVRTFTPVFEAPMTAKTFQRRPSSAPIPDSAAPFLAKQSSPKAAKPRASSQQPTSSTSFSPSPSPPATEPSSPVLGYESAWDSSDYAPSPTDSYTFPLDASYASSPSTSASSPVTATMDLPVNPACFQPQPQVPAQLSMNSLSRYSSLESIDTRYSPVTPLSAEASFSDQWGNNVGLLTMPNSPLVSQMHSHTQTLTPCSSYGSFQSAPEQDAQYGYAMQQQQGYEAVQQMSQPAIQLSGQEPTYYHQQMSAPPMANTGYIADFQVAPQFCTQQQQIPIQENYYGQYQGSTFDTTHLGFTSGVESQFYAGSMQGYAS